MNRIDVRFALYASVVALVVGGTVGAVGYFALIDAVETEALTRAAVNAESAERLLAASTPNADAADQAQNFPKGTWPLDASSRALAEQAQERGSIATAFVHTDEGLSLVSAVPVEGAVRLWTRALRSDDALVDLIDRQVFGADSLDHPHSTVTIFKGDVRIATTVRTTDGARATGTRVSKPVAQQVLRAGQPWKARAEVVGRDTLAAYRPLRDPGGVVVGMVYAGIDADVYEAEGRRAALLFLIVVAAFSVVVAIPAGLLGRRLAKPLRQLAVAAAALGRGERARVELPSSDALEVRVLAATFATMRDEIAVREDELERKRAEAADALNAYLEVLGFVAHELKGPIASAMMTLQTIEGGYVGPVLEPMGKQLGTIHRQLDYAVEMAAGFNLLSKAESGGFQVEREPLTDFAAEYLQPLIDEHAERASRKGMSVDLEGGAFAAAVDLDLFRIVVDNLVGNAVKYGREGTTVHIRVAREEEAFRMTVRNAGVGVPSERFCDLFHKFSRIKDPQLRSQRGTGLGLYFVKKIIAMHGGAVAVDGVYEEWIAFSATVPDVRGNVVNPHPG